MNPNSSSAPWAALPVLLAGAFMVVLDFFIVNVALPSIATDLQAGDSSLEWVVAGYGLTFAAFLILAGRLGDGLGRRRVYTIGLLLFTLTSAACGLAPVAARIAQGVAGAILMPQVLAIVGVTYKGPHYVRALSIYGLALGLAAVGGQVIGGALVETDFLGLGWRSCFLINIPIGIAALALTPRLVPESRADHAMRLDLTGAATVVVGLTAVLLPLIEGRELGWPTWTFVSLALAPVILTGFVRRQRRLARSGGDPLLDMRLFAERGFSAGIATQLFLAGA
jgi:MFS family permease